MLRQYILTRFNLRLWRRNKFLQPVSDGKWLEERFVLFEKYCLPSIMAQTQLDFRWIILFDAEVRFLQNLTQEELDECIGVQRT